VDWGSLEKLWRGNRFGYREFSSHDVPVVLEKCISKFKALRYSAEKGLALNLAFFVVWFFTIAAFRNPREVTRFLWEWFGFEKGGEGVEVLVHRQGGSKRAESVEPLYLLAEEYGQVNVLFAELSAERPSRGCSKGVFLRGNPWAKQKGGLFLQIGCSAMEIAQWPRLIVEVSGLNTRVPSFSEMCKVAALFKAEYGWPAGHLEELFGFGGRDVVAAYVMKASARYHDAMMMQAALVAERGEGLIFVCVCFSQFVCVQVKVMVRVARRASQC